jgi:Flp pilus assembly pilin Flp
MLEYMLILAVVIAAVAIAAGAVIRPAVDTSFTSSQTAIQNATAQLSARLQ